MMRGIRGGKGWEVEHRLSSLYWLFHDCPARHKDFMTATGCNTPILKLCKHRWIENVNVSERGLLLATCQTVHPDGRER